MGCGSGRGISGQYCIGYTAADLVKEACRRLGITSSGRESLVHGTEVVPATACIQNWPGLRPRGEVSEYQLVV
eukprot:4541739-Amphidinium_carterae.1